MSKKIISNNKKYKQYSSSVSKIKNNYNFNFESKSILPWKKLGGNWVRLLSDKLHSCEKVTMIACIRAHGDEYVGIINKEYYDLDDVVMHDDLEVVAITIDSILTGTKFRVRDPGVIDGSSEPN